MASHFPAAKRRNKIIFNDALPFRMFLISGSSFFSLGSNGRSIFGLDWHSMSEREGKFSLLVFLVEMDPKEVLVVSRKKCISGKTKISNPVFQFSLFFASFGLFLLLLPVSKFLIAFAYHKDATSQVAWLRILQMQMKVGRK